MTADPAVRAIAFYLPQFHPIPENDEWWGAGFTEWTNVAQAVPLFPGHYQPHIPADLGFYDLRLPETREAQAALARRYGVYGFCYYHYWFQGKRVLERPVEDMLRTGTPDFPFCLCWANENWTRTWGGDTRSILLGQQYSAEDDRRHIRALLPALGDPRYIRVHGKPLLSIYRVAQLPEPRRTADIWREEARKAGLGDLFLAKVESYQGENFGDPAAIGFDAGIEFAPDSTCAGLPASWGRMLRRAGIDEFSWRLFRALEIAGEPIVDMLAAVGLVPPAYVRHSVFDYDTLMTNMLARKRPDYLWFPSVTPSWDNTARRQRGGKIYKGATPEKYGAWLTEVVRRQTTRPVEERIVFINAWNEWAEGNHLEPCLRWGHQYLEATRQAVMAGG